MSTKSQIREALEREVSKLVKRHNKVAAVSQINRKRYEKRSGNAGALPTSSTPSHWSAHPQFDPYYVRSRFDSFAHAMAKKVRTLKYVPNPSLSISIPKPGGGEREIAISTVPDAAVSYWLGKRLISRNSYRFSSYTYAYRADRNAHHAIQHLMDKIFGSSRVFVLEYDFAKYFDSIKHEYLYNTLEKHFLISDREMRLLKALLSNPRAKSLADYANKKFETPTVGIPQGSNISLFLANVACFELDREIEEVGVTFARYADDTLIVSDSYEKANACAKLLLSHGKRSGTAINFNKSPGISLLTPDASAEFKPKVAVDFLSHSLSNEGIRIAAKAIARIKRRVARVIYNNLLLQPKRGAFNIKRIGPGFYDWDLVTCVNEVRRYVYGRISEKELTQALLGKSRANTTLCAMSFYPTVDEYGSHALRELDGWLKDTLARAYAKRCNVLTNFGASVKPIPANELVTGSWYNFDAIKQETTLPSFYRAWLYVRKAAETYGLEKFPSPIYEYV